MPVIHVMCGLPASGKTTAARKLLADAKGRTRRINLDDLRAMLDDSGTGERIWSHAHEQTALAIQDAALREAIEGGFDAVIDNTHLTPHIPKRLKAAALGRATFVVHDFTGVPIEECLRRDAARDNAVGEEVINRLAANHAKATKNGWRLTDDWMNDTPPVVPYVPDTSLQSAIVVDIDGTLALKGDRGPYDFARCGEDTLNESVRRGIESFKRAHADRIILLSGRGEDLLNESVRRGIESFKRAHADRIILLSGRGEEYREQTETWLDKHFIRYDELWMRPAGDTRRDDIVKAELFDAHLRHRFNVRLSLDDRDRVVALWRRMGLPTWQVNYGAF